MTSKFSEWAKKFQGSITKYSILFLACGFVYGSAAGYDSPATTQKHLEAYFGTDNFTPLMYNMLYSFYSFPNIVLPLYSGTMVQRLGLHSTIVLLTMIVFTGVFTYGLGVQSKSFETMIAGRLLLGVGAETLAVVQSSLVTRYFLATDLSFALSLTLSIGRASSIINYQMLPAIATARGVVAASWMATMASCISVACGFAAVTIDRRKAAKDLTARVGVESVEPKDMSASNHETKISKTHARDSPPDSDEISLSERASVKNRSRASLHVVETRDPENVPSNDDANPLLIGGEANVGDAHFVMRPFKKLFRYLLTVMPADIDQLPQAFWILTLVLICYVTATINFLPMAPAFIRAKFYPDDTESDYSTNIVSTPDMLSFFLMPLIGFLSDRSASAGTTGPRTHRQRVQSQIWKARQCMFSGICMFVAHVMFAITYIHPLFVLLVLGFGYAMYGSAVYSLMADIVSKEETEEESRNAAANNETRVASAYGISGCLSNTVFALVPILVGFLVAGRFLSEDELENAEADTSSGPEKYYPMEVFFAGTALVGVVCCLYLERNLRRQL